MGRAIRLTMCGLPFSLSTTAASNVPTSLRGSEAALIVLGEPTLDKAVAHASKTLKHVVDATADELAKEVKEAAKA